MGFILRLIGNLTLQGEFLAAPTVRQGAAGHAWAPGWYHENGNSSQNPRA